MDNLLMFLSGVVAMLIALMAWVLLSDLINRKKETAQAKFNRDLIRFWEQAHDDAYSRNIILGEIRDAIQEWR